MPPMSAAPAPFRPRPPIAPIARLSAAFCCTIAICPATLAACRGMVAYHPRSCNGITPQFNCGACPHYSPRPTDKNIRRIPRYGCYSRYPAATRLVPVYHLNTLAPRDYPRNASRSARSTTDFAPTGLSAGLQPAARPTTKPAPRTNYSLRHSAAWLLFAPRMLAAASARRVFAERPYRTDPITRAADHHTTIAARDSPRN
jgi:hypothetical protein